ncbi:MAG TPA: hypothetical protein GXX46_03520 [Peptococcaceae bacterium]|nr:hypothetical protein [Peptococcaceae bacterium]
MKIPFLAFVLQGIPESIAMVTLAFVIARIPLQWKKIIAIGLIMATTSYILRLFPITFGIHTVLLIVLLFILLIRVERTNINALLISSLLSHLVVIIAETICLGLLMSLLHISFEVLYNNVALRILMTLPQVILIFIIAYITLKIRSKKGKF